MAQPVLYTIASFDATANAVISFAYEGDQVFGNELVIVENATNKQVYDVKKNNWMRLTHEINAKNSGLKNGTYYAAKVRVFNKAGVASEWSEQRTFYCLTQGKLIFTNIANDSIIQDNEFTFDLEYTQPEHELLSAYSVALYDVNKTLLRKSETLSGDAAQLGYTFSEMEDGKQYYVRAEGLTVNGMDVLSDFVLFSVHYLMSNYWAYADLSNNAYDGTVRIGCNVRLITARFEGDGNPKYEDHDKVVLKRSGDKVVFDSTFVQEGDFTMKLLVRDLIVGTTFFEMIDENGMLVALRFRTAWASADSYMANGKQSENAFLGCFVKFIELRVSSPKNVLTYTLFTRALDDLGSDQDYVVELERKGDVYALRAAVATAESYVSTEEDV